MEHLLPYETELTGRWIEAAGQVRGDDFCNRISYLTSASLDLIQNHPKFGGWTTLFRDRADGRYWERSYPQSELHGGGPPALRWISDDEVMSEYGLRP